MAPFTPFVTERVWQDLVVSSDPHAPASVHLARWPDADEALVDDALGAQVRLVRRLVELGRAARADSGIKTRQPLPRAFVGASGWDAVPEALRDQLAEELNVVAVIGLGASGDELVEVSAKANFRTLGKRFGQRTPAVAAAVAAADAADLAGTLRRTGSARLTVDGGPVELTPEDVIVTETPREGWAVAHDAGESLALDLTLTPELRRLGLVRECVRLVQEARKTSGLEVADRIRLWWEADEGSELAVALEEHGPLVAEEVLALELDRGAPSPTRATPLTEHRNDDLGLVFWLERA
jgi:isoleucyl-tRNA synthetase